MSGATDAEGNFVHHDPINTLAEGWHIFVQIDGKWQLFKFTTQKKKRKVETMVAGLRKKYNGLRFKYEAGWLLTPPETESNNVEETETRVEGKEVRKHVICGTDCESPCTKEIEDEGRDWREHQFSHRHTALCAEDCGTVEDGPSGPAESEVEDTQGREASIDG